MIQVDPFLAYGISSAFALAGAPRALTTPSAPRPAALKATLLFLGLLFVPCGLWLLHAFPAWETMQVIPDPPGWLALAFTAGVLTAGTAGVLVTEHLLRRGLFKAALLQTAWPTFAIVTLFLHGWDGTGLRRLLTAAPAQWPATARSRVTDLAGHWVGTSVALTLAVMLATVTPVVFWLLRRLSLNAQQSQGPRLAAAATRFATALLAFMACPGILAAACLVLLMRMLGEAAGCVVFTITALPLLHPRGPLARALATCSLNPALRPAKALIRRSEAQQL
ncbi:hypothetical protein [Streptomyces sp. NPDC047028]|uniref:hypothetical protein n=1 Tax=Streptomyces sp. NPDC047028 TaxID=3155793 RepID=UPI0033E98021